MRRLYDQINAYPKRLVIGVGNYALWALSSESGSQTLRESNGRPIPPEAQTYGPTGIMDWRGSMLFVEPIPEYLNGKPYPRIPFLPIIHSANILRQWSNRAVTVHDLKARVPLALANDWENPNPPVLLAPPSFEDCISVLTSMRTRMGETRLAVDIETARGFITCLGISDSPQFAMSIPFIRKHEDGGFDSHWTKEQEAHIIHHLRELFVSPRVLVEGQNFIYDTQYIQHWMGVTPRVDFDTMLAQNVAFPGTPKDLGYLSSLYCRYHRYWKEDHKEWNLSGTVEQLLRYNCEDCARTWEIAESQRQLLRVLKLEDQMRFKMKVHHLCLRMMNRGVRIDTSKRASLLFELNAALQNLYKELYHIVPQEIVKPNSETPWYTSAQQKAHLLYEVLGLRQQSHRKTGNRTVGKEALRALRKQYPEFSGLFTRLNYAGSIANTVHVIRTPLDPDLRMRCSFNPGGTENAQALLFGECVRPRDQLTESHEGGGR